MWLSLLGLQVLGYLDILFNLVEDKETAHSYVRAAERLPARRRAPLVGRPPGVPRPRRVGADERG